MFPILDLVATVGGLVAPPLFDFLKKKFIKAENDTPERTIGTLATTKPETLPDYVKALSILLDAKVKFFNRDVIGTPSMWVVDLRAAIRPIGVVCAFAYLVALAILIVSGYMPELTGVAADTITGTRATSELMLSSWFGHRFTISK
jgi:hypothetical protein